MGRRVAASESNASNGHDDHSAANGFGSVLILLPDASLVKSLVAVFRRNKLEARTFSSPRQLLTAQLPNHPTCLVACVSGGAQCGLPAYEELKKNGIYLPVVFLAQTTDLRLAVKAMRAGAEDLLPLPVENEVLLEAVGRAIDQSRRFLDACSKQLVLRQQAGSLSDREREIVRLVVGGMLNKEIAAELRISLATVKQHRGKAMRKLGARTSAELARIARAMGIKASRRENHAPLLVQNPEMPRPGNITPRRSR